MDSAVAANTFTCNPVVVQPKTGRHKRCGVTDMKLAIEFNGIYGKFQEMLAYVRLRMFLSHNLFFSQSTPSTWML